MVDVSLYIAFAAGVVSFLSPCVLPIIPGFLAYLSGTSTAGAPSRWQTFLASVFFVLGFSAVFAVLGVLLNTLLSSVAYEVQTWLSRLGGVVIIFFGLYLVGLVKVGFLDRPHTIRITRRLGPRELTAFLFGAAFAVGWTPCVGAALGAILGLAATNPATALSLLFAYAVGLGVPFLLVGLFATQATNFINRFAGALVWVSRIFGVVLVVLGVLVFTQSLSLVANLDLVNRLLLQ